MSPAPLIAEDSPTEDEPEHLEFSFGRWRVVAGFGLGNPAMYYKSAIGCATDPSGKVAFAVVTPHEPRGHFQVQIFMIHPTAHSLLEKIQDGSMRIPTRVAA